MEWSEFKSFPNTIPYANYKEAHLGVSLKSLLLVTDYK